MLLGPIIEVEARTEIRWPVVKLTESGEESVREIPDYAAVIGKTRSGALFSAELEGGVQPENLRFSFELRGSEGWLSLTSNSPYGFQAGNVTLSSNVAFVEPDATAVSGGLMGASINVGEVYAHLVRDLRAGTYSTPSFEHALHNARLIEAVRRSADQGQRQKVTS